MCGILGIIGALPDGCNPDAALDTLIHRGPDDRGVYSDDHAWLGHRRLSIIDLGPGGHQPMIEPQSGVVVTYNGEIYNYIELRRELEGRGHAFRSSCDTEVLLHAYLEWGPECVEHFNGMWAFIIWDPRERRAFIARDRFGVKPFCYAIVDGALAIASEPKALVTAFPQLGRVDTSTLHDLLVDKHVGHDERTFYASIKSLPAGHRGTFQAGDHSPRVERYWSYPVAGREQRWDREATLEQFSELLGDAVRLRLRSDVPVGVTVSGGVDSTAILDAMAGIRAARQADVKSYTAVYPDSPHHGALDERRWARSAAGRYDNVELTEVEAPRERWLDVLRRITWHMDGPCRSPQVFPMWMMMERARADGVPVLLEGQGADEVFGGYGNYPALAVVDRVREGPRRGRDSGWAAVRGVAQAGARASSPTRLLKDIGITTLAPVRAVHARRTSLRAVLKEDVLGASRAEDSYKRDGRGRLEAQLHRDFAHDILPGALRFGDAVSMGNSIEIRLPFLDYRLVEFGISLPPAARISAGWTKRLMREYLHGVGQSEIADRRDKKGFPTPAYAWLAADNGAILKELLLDRGAEIGAIVDQRRLEHVIARHAEGRYSAGEVLYSLVATELWWEQAARPPKSERLSKPVATIG
jgi:asparagine synthase (glutamine-hydrolysing)